MISNRKLKFVKVVSLSIFFIAVFSIVFLGIKKSVPKEYNISLGDEYTFESKLPISYSMISVKDKILELYESDNQLKNQLINKNTFQIKPLEKGTTDIQLKLLGLIPYRTVKVNIVPKIEVIPGGESIGVKLNTDGVLIIATADLEDQDGKIHNIGAEAGIKIGDTLLKINEIKINNATHVSQILKDNDKKDITLTMKRDNREFTVNISPIQSGQDGQYRLGLWVRDKTAGVGTLSFYHEKSGKFGALGHAITDVDTGALLSVKDGQIIKSKVISIQQGEKGKPGEIRGVFYESSNPIGRLQYNTKIGVYGTLFMNNIPDIISKKSIPIAYQHEIKEGPAYILTTLDDNEIEKFDIEITNVNYQTKADSKSMVIKITDSRLLERTGGIVQGMSGSPIIQNGKIVGAVTHVLVNDPTKGYGIFIEWMIEEAGINDKN